MKLFNYDISVSNISKKRPARMDVKKVIIAQQQLRFKQDIEDWRKALDDAENVHNPNRADLIRLFKEIDLDGHLTGIVNAIKSKVKSREFAIYDESGEKNEELTDNFTQEWFYDFLDYFIEAYFWGYTLIEFGNIKDDAFESIENIKREYIVPEWGLLKKNLNSSADGIKFLEPPYDRWTLFVFPQAHQNMGLYNKVAPHALGKKNMLISAWRHAELFGSPFRVMTTDLRDSKRRYTAEKMMEEMGQAGYAVLDEEDDIQIHQQTATDAYKVFLEPYEVSNNEMSKCIAGQTGVFEEKAFVGSSLVHERLFDDFINIKLREIKFTVNNMLIPKMVRLGMPYAGKTFNWIFEEKISLKDRVEIIKGLSSFYEFPIEWLNDYLELEIEEKKSSSQENSFEEKKESAKDMINNYAEINNLYQLDEQDNTRDIRCNC